MTTDERLAGLAKLGYYVHAIDEAELEEVILKVRNENPWFTPGSVNLALAGIRRYLDPSKMQTWTSAYRTNPKTIKKIAVVMAGNIPLAGFHDLLSILVSGHSAVVKLSSKDSILTSHLIGKLTALEPRFSPLIAVETQLRNFDAVIATGSDNSSRYFQYYFGKYPHIIRKNRTSCAILSGTENAEDLMRLGSDVFTYFGLGCRNVSKIFVPENFDLTRLIKAWDIYIDIIHHHKYHNNYDYQKSILLVNKIPFYDSGFVILHENEKLVSPISVVYFERYADEGDLSRKLESISEKIQCIVGARKDHVRFGEAQSPELWDYADRVDTLKFLETLD